MTPEQEQPREKRHKLIEDIFILLCIASLWPVVLGWTEPIYQYLLYVALAGLIFISCGASAASTTPATPYAMPRTVRR